MADETDGVIIQVDLATGQSRNLAGESGTRAVVDGPAGVGRLFAPVGLMMASDGNLYFGDHQTLRRMVAATGAVETVAGSPAQAGAADGLGMAAQFNGPNVVSNDGAGTLVVSDGGNFTIREISLPGGAVTTRAGLPGKTSGAGTFSEITGLAIEPGGDIFAADDRQFVVDRIDRMTGAITTFAGMPGAIGGSDGAGTAARFWTPTGITRDAAGDLYVTDSPSAAVRKISLADAKVTTVLPAIAANGSITGLSFPEGIAVDRDGTVYVSQTNDHTIARVDLAATKTTILAGTSMTAGSADGTGPAAGFNHPAGIAIDGHGNLFVADRDNGAIRKIIVATGQVTTVVGGAGCGGVRTGTVGACLNQPTSVTVLPSGELIITDQAENVVLSAH